MPLDGAAAFDWHNPDYGPVIARREHRLRNLRKQPEIIEGLLEYYRDHVADFINDWGWTFDPRNIEVGLPGNVPFILFPKQREWVDWVIDNWRNQQRCLTEKSRTMGVSWLSVALGVSMCVLHEGFVVGYGSRTEDYVDKIGDSKSLFWKAREFVRNLPPEFRAGHDPAKHAPHLRILFPETGSSMTGEAGDNIGRGNRTAIYMVDEAAFIQHQQLLEASLSQTTNCRVDISTPNGLGNPFEQNRHSGRIPIFTFHWTSHPQKDEEWYEKQKRDLSPVVVAQEIDIDYTASVERIIVPHSWVLSAIDAHSKLGIGLSGARSAAFDVADEGLDTNAICGAHGILVDHLEEWSGQGDNIFGSVERALLTCDEHNYATLIYDADGLGAAVRGDGSVINQRRRSQGQREVTVMPFRGSSSPARPESEDIPGRKNKDFFANLKAQGWWSLRQRFERTHLWVTQGIECRPDDVISLSSQLENVMKLANELSQPTYWINGVGKLQIDKMPDGAKSPNLADAVMMRFAPRSSAVIVSEEAIATMMRRG